jgi:hypothetical protein
LYQEVDQAGGELQPLQDKINDTKAALASELTKADPEKMGKLRETLSALQQQRADAVARAAANGAEDAETKIASADKDYSRAMNLTRLGDKLEPLSGDVRLQRSAQPVQLRFLPRQRQEQAGAHTSHWTRSCGRTARRGLPRSQHEAATRTCGKSHWWARRAGRRCVRGHNVPGGSVQGFSVAPASQPAPATSGTQSEPSLGDVARKNRQVQQPQQEVPAGSSPNVMSTHDQIHQLLVLNKFSTDKDFADFVETSAMAWINADPNRAARWSAGGDSRIIVVNEAFIHVMKNVDAARRTQ